MFVGVLMEPLQVMSLLLEALVQVFVLLLKVKALLKLFSLLAPLTQTQTTMPQTRPGGA